MPVSTKELREKRHALAKQMHALVETAAQEARALTSDERTKFDALENDERAMKETIDVAEKLGPLEEERSAMRDDLHQRHDFDAKRRDRPSVADYRDAFRAWALGKKAPSELRKRAEKCGVDIFRDEFHFDEMTRRASTAATHAGSTATGADGVATEPLQALVETVKKTGGIREVANVIVTQTGGTLSFPVIDDTSAVAVIVGESTARETQSPVLGAKTIAAHTYSSNIVKASIEFVQDEGFNFGAWLGNALGLRIARGTNAHFTIGSGSGQPHGAITEAMKGVQPSSAVANISTTNLIALVHSVDPAWRMRPGTAFMMHDHTLKEAKSLVDSQGRPLWLPGLSAGEPDTLLGYPYVINNDMATNTSATSDIKIVAFGNWQSYYIRDVAGGGAIVRLDERFADVGQIGWLSHTRHGGRTIASSATTTLWPIMTLWTQIRT